MTSTSDTSAKAMLEEARAGTETRLRVIALRLRRQHPGRLGEGFEYALGTIGKRVRPALVLASYRAAGGASPAIDGVGAAVEIVHTYSLVHDDLPCMDDDDQRRGRPTTHVQFDVELASLIGWLLVPVAVEQLLEACAELNLTMGVAGRMAVTLLEAGGIRGMIGGQWLDLEAEGQARDLNGVMEIHRRKTGALIQASCVLGALAAGAAEEEITSLAGYGREIGLAFQIADDILDVTATTSQLGKTAGRDMALAKSTYVSLLGVEGARREAERRAELAIGHLTPTLSSETLTGLARYIVSRTS